MSKCADINHIEYILSLDSDDPELKNYLHLFEPTGCIILISGNKNLVQATNKGAEVTKGEILILVSDDFECPKDWDLAIMGAFVGNSCSVLKTFDGTQGWIVTLPVMDRAYYLEQGYFYFPEYFHMFCDTDMTHKADIEGKLIVRNDLIFKHNHYSVSGARRDAISKKADSTWDQGERVYLRRVREKFGLSGVNVMNFNHQPHKDWLNAKMR